MRYRIKPRFWFYPILSFLGWVVGQAILLIFASVLAMLIFAAIISCFK
jgi:hypothetical protein